VSDTTDAPPEIVARLRAVCCGLPDAYEEPAWVGTRWRVRKKTFAHVLTLASGWPPAYVKAADHEGPVTVMTFRAPPADLEALANVGHPFFRARWGRDVAGMVLEAGEDAETDWDEVAELVTESYCVMAPKKLVALVDRPEPG
jgi:YjbR